MLSAINKGLCVLASGLLAAVSGCQGYGGCPAGRTDCEGICVDMQLDPSNCGACGIQCDPGESCVAGTCRCGGSGEDCGADETCCGTACVILVTDERHCGACERACSDGEACCGGGCANLLEDEGNCGSCGRVCAAEEHCSGGVCCPPGQGNCDLHEQNGCETDLLAGPGDCGACDAVCPEGEHCSGGLCCGQTRGNCDRDMENGCETDLQTDARHCGGCGAECNPGELCVEGACRCGGSGPTCAGGRGSVCCGTECVDLDEDDSHCGACEAACDEGLHCAGGMCCEPGLGNCDGDEDNGCETDLTMGPEDCGECGVNCDQGEVCVDGACRCGGAGPDCAPPPGENCCGTTCSSTYDDDEHCGICWNACDEDQHCQGYMCCPVGYGNCDLDPDNGCEKDILSDEASCGGCMITCDPGELCTDGICRCAGSGLECHSSLGWTCCGTACVKLENDECNCGGCGVTCDQGEICIDGVCRCGRSGPDCTEDQVCCCTACVDRDGSDPPCGGCTPSCGAGEECICDRCVDIEWVAIPGGTFMMGSPEGEGNADEHPRHEVTVPDFEMLRTEVTVAQYRHCVESGVCTEPLHSVDDDCVSCDKANWGAPDRDDHPVNFVSAYQAMEFCTWAGGRLPSEAEWEYAARSGGRDITYPWGYEEATCEYAVMFGYGPGIDDPYGCGLHHTWAVCSKPAGNTVHGLCDMAGNVWESVQDYYHTSYDGAPSDGSAWNDVSSISTLRRGGAWDTSAESLRVTNRLGSTPNSTFEPNTGFDCYGFRCARDCD